MTLTALYSSAFLRAKYVYGKLLFIQMALVICFLTAIPGSALADGEPCDTTLFANIDTSICAGESLIVGSNIYTSTGQYTDSLLSSNGCDSIVATNLTVLPAASVLLTFSICTGDTIFVGNSFYTTSGTFTDTLTAANGCDSIVTSQVTVREASAASLSFSICQGDSVVVGNSVYQSAGIFTDTLSNANGCDSIITTTISVTPSKSSQLTFSICRGDTVVVGNSFYTTSGTFTDTLSAANGCDSIVTSQVTVREASAASLSFSICQGDSVVVGNSVYQSAGVFTDTLSNANGCDSIITSTISLLGTDPVNISLSICQGESVTVGSNTYTNTGIYLDTLSAANGCDSIVNLNLTVIPAKTFAQTLTICRGDSIVVGNNIYKVSGTYVDTLTAGTGCDSIITTQLTVNERFAFTQNLSICAGDSVIVGNSIYKQPGTYTDSLLSAGQCDSVIITNLSVRPVFRPSVTAQICTGQSYTVGNNTYTVAGTYVDSLKTASGCDSIITTTLTVVSAIRTNLEISICPGESFTVGNNTYTEAGTYIDTLTSAGGCDSIITTQLTLGGIISIERMVAICQGEIFSFGDTILLSPGVYVQVFENAEGCDSIVTLTLIVNPTPQTNISLQACQGESITVNGISYTQNTSFSIRDTSYLGCDSTINYILTFNPRNTTNLNLNICIPGNFEGNPVNADTLIVKNLINRFGCDSTVNVRITAAFPAETEAATALCFNTPYEGFIVQRDTIIEKQLQTFLGCDSIVTEFITVLPLPVLTVSRDTTVNPGSTVTLFASGAANYAWSTGQSGPVISVNPNQETTYTVIGTAENGCTDTASIRINVNACQIEVPTLFTPNGDGIHDVLKIKGADCLVSFQMAILNRWGDVLYETADLNAPWDGTRNGNQLPEGVYYYVLSGTSVVDSQPVLIKGYFHIKR